MRRVSRRISLILVITGSGLISVNARQLSNVYVVPDNKVKSELVESAPILETEESLPVSSEMEISPLQHPQYPVWNVASLQGKLKMKGLPLTPNVKIFMTKDSLVDISIRAAFVGEAGRLTVTSDSVLAVNKINKTYVKEALPKNRIIDGIATISDLQDLILGRFFLPGVEFNEDNLGEFVDIFSFEGNYNIIPKGVAEKEGVKYGFTVDPLFRPLMLMVLPETQPGMEIDAIYDWKKDGYDITVNYIDGNQLVTATLELKTPEWGGEPLGEIDLSKKYRQVGLGDFLRNMR